jgi:hypothetical protein
VIQPPRWRRPRNEILPGIAPAALTIARTEETVAALAGMRGYPTGFSFTLSLRLRNVSPREKQQLWPFPEPSGSRIGEPLPGKFLRFGVQFADCRKATNLDRPAYSPEGQESNRPMLIEGPGTAGEADGWVWDMDYGVTPLPPSGPVAFVCAWPGRGIMESRAEIDAGSILDAAGGAVTFWANGGSCSPYC